jgi:hypothetical protein
MGDEMAESRGVVHGLWIGDRLGSMQRCSIASFVAAGYAYHLHTYGSVADVPDGALVRDAEAIIPADRIWRYRDYDSPAGFSNQFRYRLLRVLGGTWADLDVICLGPLPEGEYLLAQQDYPPARAANCLMRAPASSELLRRASAIADAADTTTLAWGDIGPGLISRLVEELDLPLLPASAVCPVDFTDWRVVLSPDPDIQAELRRRLSGSAAIHLWHEMWRRDGVDVDDPGPPGCLYRSLLERFEVIGVGSCRPEAVPLG